MSILVDQLINARDLYNNGIESPLTDNEYDLLEEELKKTDPANVFFTGVGSDVRGDKVLLPFPMGSLEQVHENDAAKWVKDNSLEDVRLMITSKMDGISNQIIYNNTSKFQIGYSRGNGIEGADISRHLRKIKNIPDKINLTETTAIRAEVIMSKSNFKKFQIECISRKYKTYKNPRNAVAGLMNSKDLPDWIYSYLEVIPFELIGELDKDIQLSKLKNIFDICVTHFICLGSEINDDMLSKHIISNKDTGPLSDYEQDGVVIDVIDSTIRKSLNTNNTSLNPKYARKFKIREDRNVVEVIVEKVLWSPSKNGLLKPRIQIKPIELNGVTITYTAGFNAKYIVDNTIGPGTHLMLTRSGDVIPYILSVVSTLGHPSVPDFSDFGPYEWNKTQVDYILTTSNGIVDMKAILSFFQSLDISNMGTGSVKKLINANYNSIADILNMSKEELIEVIGKNGIKIFDSINEKFDNIAQYEFMGSLPFFPGIGKRKFEKIYDNIGTFIHITDYQILSSNGFDDTSADVVLTNLHKYYQIIEDIDRIIIFKDKVIQTGIFDNVEFVFTGYRDKTANSIIESNGGIISKSINSKTTYLVAKEPNSTSSKFVKARLLGVTILSIQELNELLENA